MDFNLGNGFSFNFSGHLEQKIGGVSTDLNTGKVGIPIRDNLTVYPDGNAIVNVDSDEGADEPKDKQIDEQAEEVVTKKLWWKFWQMSNKFIVLYRIYLGGKRCFYDPEYPKIIRCPVYDETNKKLYHYNVRMIATGLHDFLSRYMINGQYNKMVL